MMPALSAVEGFLRVEFGHRQIINVVHVGAGSPRPGLCPTRDYRMNLVVLKISITPYASGTGTVPLHTSNQKHWDLHPSVLSLLRNSIEQFRYLHCSLFRVFPIIVIRTDTDFSLFRLVNDHERTSIKLADNIPLHNLSPFEFHPILTTTNKIKNAFIP